MSVTIHDLGAWKAEGTRFAMLTAYDFPTAKLLDEAGIPVLLVGDSVGNNVLGYENTLPVTMEEMLHHTRAVVRGTRRSLVVGDMPFLSYASVDEAIDNAGRFLQDGGAQAVKIEGGVRSARVVEALVKAGIPVQGHIGWTPQSAGGMGGKVKVQGKTREAVRALLADAVSIQEAGAFSIVLELMPEQLAALITERLKIPTIGIGAGASCSGQVQVITDLLGFGDFIPKHAKPNANLRQVIGDAATLYIAEVRGGTFPGAEQSVRMDEAVLDEALGRTADDRAAAVDLEAGIPLDRDL